MANGQPSGTAEAFGEADSENDGGPPSAVTGERRLLLVDCDQFYVQVARLEHPRELGSVELLIVGGSATGRGVVTSASYATRAFGVRSAMPTAQALRLCPEATVTGVPREACARRSRDVKHCLRRLAPVVQAASIDEFYLDVSGTERLFHGETLEDTAWRIRERVLDQTQISVSVGGGTTRVVAKLATRLAKPGGVHIVPAGEEGRFLQQFELSQIPGVGPTLARSLARRGLVTVRDALPVDEDWFRRWLGPTRGTWLHRRIRGIDGSSVDPREPRKSVSSERTFAEDLSSDDELERQLMKLAMSTGRHLRKGGLRARTITVKLRDADFRTRTASQTFPDAIESDGTIYEVARELLSDLRSRRRMPARLLGVGLTNLTNDDPAAPQLGLFDDESATESPEQRTLAHTIDDLKERFGDGAVVPGRVVRNDP